MLDAKIAHLPLAEYTAALPATMGFYEAHEIEAGEPHELYGSEPFVAIGEVLEVVCTRAAARSNGGKGRGQLVVVRRKSDGRCAYFDAKVARDLFESKPRAVVRPCDEEIDGVQTRTWDVCLERGGVCIASGFATRAEASAYAAKEND